MGSSSSSLEHIFQAAFEIVIPLLFRDNDRLLLWLILLILVTKDGCSFSNNLAANAEVLLLRFLFLFLITEDRCSLSDDLTTNAKVLLLWFLFLLLITEDGCSLSNLALNSKVFGLPNLLLVVLVAKWRSFDTW